MEAAQAKQQVAITIRGLTRRFGAKTAVHPTDLEIGAGAITGLLGPNGSGKSTLMRMLTGLVRPHGGSAVIAGTPLRGEGTAVRRVLTYAPGELGVYGELRGREHLRWSLRGRPASALDRAVEVASWLGLPLDHKVRTYSHGMKRQLLFSAALAPDVPVRILDEPTEGLDPSKRGQVLELLHQDVAKGTTVLLSSHHLQEVDHACERLIFVNEGRIVADEAADVLRRRAMSLVKLRFREGLAHESLESALTALGHGTVHRTGRTFDLVLDADDPRPFLGALAQSALPAPEAIEYGNPSLQDLYRELYGVEGI